MGKVNSTFEKGLSTDFSPLKQPKGTYLNAENIVRDVMGTVKSEAGTTLLAELALTNATVIGETTVEDEIIFFIKSDEGSSIIKLLADNSTQVILQTGPGFPDPVTEQVWKIGAKDDDIASEFSVLETGSAKGKLTLTLTDTNTVTATVTMSSPSSPPMYVKVPFVATQTNIVVPPALMPTELQFGTIQNTYPGGAPGIGFWISATNISSPTFYWSPAGGGFASFFIDTPIEYEAVGLSESSISTDLLNFDAAIQAVARRDYQGNIILYWVDKNNIPRRLDTSDLITAVNFSEKLTLFTNPTLPRVTDLEVIESGGITTGLYKFAARLVTQTGNVTTFSQISQGIPIVNDSKGAGMHQYDGAPPQTPAGKSIKINLENIDTTYNFVEIVAITYLGEENLLTAFVVGKIPITSSTLEFEYYSDGQQLEEVLLEELVAEAVEYTQAKSIVQKDNHLFLANLSAADLAFVDETMITLAEQIEVHFKVKYGTLPNISYTTSTSGGVGGGVWSTAPSSGGTDGNVYAFTDLTIDPIVDTSFNTTLGRISTKEDNAAETGTRLRSWQNGDGTLHHRMPSHTRLPVDDIPGSLAAIGLDFKNIDLAAVGLDTILEGYTIVRQRRNKPGNGIVITTGVAKELCDDRGGGLLS